MLSGKSLAGGPQFTILVTKPFSGLPFVTFRLYTNETVEWLTSPKRIRLRVSLPYRQAQLVRRCLQEQGHLNRLVRVHRDHQSLVRPLTAQQKDCDKRAQHRGLLAGVSNDLRLKAGLCSR